MIQVTLTFEDQDALVAFFTRGAVPVVAQAETSKVIEKAAKPPKPVTAKAEPVAAQAAPAAETTAPTETATTPDPTPTETTKATEAFTLEAVRAKLAAISQGGKQAQVKDLIATFNVTRLTDIKTEQYADLMAKAAAL